MNEVHRAASDGYTQGAQTYAQGRPGFPPESLIWLTRDLQLGAGKLVVELGAGTGKFTQLLARTGAEVLAVEPVVAMLGQLAADLPAVNTLRASAQKLPLGEHTADAVICAQSFHWFASAVTLAEIHRVLKPGGVLGLIWNVRDRNVPWVDDLSRLVDRHEGDAPRYDQGEWRKVFPATGFAPFQEKCVAHAHVGPAEQVIVGRTASVSFVAAMAEPARRTLLDEVRALIGATPELTNKPVVSMPYVTQMYWCRTY